MFGLHRRKPQPPHAIVGLTLVLVGTSSIFVGASVADITNIVAPSVAALAAVNGNSILSFPNAVALPVAAASVTMLGEKWTEVAQNPSKGGLC